jgi:hypothetical protein
MPVLMRIKYWQPSGAGTPAWLSGGLDHKTPQAERSDLRLSLEEARNWMSHIGAEGTSRRPLQAGTWRSNRLGVEISAIAYTIEMTD